MDVVLSQSTQPVVAQPPQPPNQSVAVKLSGATGEPITGLQIFSL